MHGDSVCLSVVFKNSFYIKKMSLFVYGMNCKVFLQNYLSFDFAYDFC